MEERLIMNNDSLENVIFEIECHIKNIKNEIIEKRIHLHNAITYLNLQKDDLENILGKLKLILNNTEKTEVD